MRTTKWQEYSRSWQGQNPPLLTCKREIGEKDGVMWLCEVFYNYANKKFAVLFDTDTEDETGFPFCREEVLNAPDWKYGLMVEKVYHRIYCDYEEIGEAVERFARNNGIEYIEAAHF